MKSLNESYFHQSIFNDELSFLYAIITIHLIRLLFAEKIAA